MPNQEPPDTGFPPPPTRVVGGWVRYVLGFGVSVAIGLSPFLGNVGVPGFRPILNLFPQLPNDTRSTIIPLSSFLMGVVAVVVQFLAYERRIQTRVRGLFVRTLVVAAIAFMLFMITHAVVVE